MLRHKCREHGGIKGPTRSAADFRWIRSSLLATVVARLFQDDKEHSNLDLS
jgi:hypothetical protein